MQVIKSELQPSKGMLTLLAINRFFDFPNGKLYLKQITDTTFRVNWYADNTIIKSAFVKVTETKDGMLVEDLTK